MKKTVILLVAIFLCVSSLTACGDRITSGSLEIEGGIYTGELTNGKATGVGEIKYDNGNIYAGPVVDGKPEGQGTMLDVLSEGSYAGGFVAGLYEGEGQFEFDNGGLYEGNFSAGRMKGNGRFVWPNGPIFEGTFDGVGDNVGELTGEGKLVYDAVVTYEGKIKAGFPNSPDGDGVFTWNQSKPSYTGTFIDFLTGAGRLDMGNGIFYEGPMGHGILNKVDGFENKVRIEYPQEEPYKGEVFEGEYLLDEGGGIVLLGSVVFPDSTRLDNIAIKLDFSFAYAPYEPSVTPPKEGGIDVGGGVMYYGDKNADDIPSGQGSYEWPNSGPVFDCESKEAYRTEGIATGFGSLDMKNGIVYIGPMNAFALMPAFDIVDVTILYPDEAVFTGQYEQEGEAFVIRGTLKTKDGTETEGTVSTNYAFAWTPNA